MKRTDLLPLAETILSQIITDWIPFATPPVRVGVYEVRSVASGTHGKVWRAEFDGKQWRQAEHTPPLKPGALMDHAMAYPEKYLWRGVRRWVLQGPADNLLTRIAGEPVDVFLEDARPRSAKWNGLANARPFKSEAAAQRFAARYHQLGLTAVLP